VHPFPDPAPVFGKSEARCAMTTLTSTRYRPDSLPSFLWQKIRFQVADPIIHVSVAFSNDVLAVKSSHHGSIVL
jgi:hypothetical protein